jgi:mannose-6-phosphate isomerase
VNRVFPAQADRFFRAELLHVDGEHDLTAEFAALIVLGGSGRLRAGDSEPIDVRRGSVFLLPYAAGTVSISGTLTAIRCLSPLGSHRAG